MIRFVTKRNLLKELHKTRWDVGKNFGSWQNRYHGIPEKELSLELYKKMVTEKMEKKSTRMILWLMRKFKKDYLDWYMPKIEDVLKDCLEEKDLRKDGGYLQLTAKGKSMIKWYYYPGIFFNNPYTKAIIIGIIMIFVTNYITQNIINKVSSAVSK
jgi:hypothetical protein